VVLCFFVGLCWRFCFDVGGVRCQLCGAWPHIWFPLCYPPELSRPLFFSWCAVSLFFCSVPVLPCEGMHGDVCGCALGGFFQPPGAFPCLIGFVVSGLGYSSLFG